MSNRVRKFETTIRRIPVLIEVWPQGDGRFDGLAFCPKEVCRDREGFQARSRYSVNKAKTDAKSAVSQHLRKVHKV